MLLQILKMVKQGYGIIIHDWEGKVCGTFQASYCFVLTSFNAETLAFLNEVLFCKDAGFYRLHLEGDALQIIQLINNKATDWSEGV